MKIGIYPGTFDPVTKGHLHLIERASKMVDKLIVAVADNKRKGPLFDVAERMVMINTDVANMHHKYCPIEVVSFNNLLVDFALAQNAQFIFRGLRAVSDFEFEFQLTGMNAKLAPELETVFLMASDKWQFVASSFIKEIASLGGDVSAFVTPHVLAQLQKKFAI